MTMEGALVVISVPTQSPGSAMMVRTMGVWLPPGLVILLVLFTFNLCGPKEKLFALTIPY